MSTAFFSHTACRGHDMGEGHPECPQRLDAIADHLRATGLDLFLAHHDAPEATAEQLTRAHAANYVGQLVDRLGTVAHEGRPQALDPDTVAAPGTLAAALRAAGAAVAATDPSSPAARSTPSAPCARRATMPRAMRPWASASSTTWPWRRATRSTCTDSSAWP
jgi:acetoin utilization deacetylase AcuC-like enzyme